MFIDFHRTKFYKCHNFFSYYVKIKLRILRGADILFTLILHRLLNHYSPHLLYVPVVNISYNLKKKKKQLCYKK